MQQKKIVFFLHHGVAAKFRQFTIKFKQFFKQWQRIKFAEVRNVRKL